MNEYPHQDITEQVIGAPIEIHKALASIHEAQLITYLKLSGLKVGLLINFNEKQLRDGLVRRVL